MPDIGNINNYMSEATAARKGASVIEAPPISEIIHNQILEQIKNFDVAQKNLENEIEQLHRRLKDTILALTMLRQSSEIYSKAQENTEERAINKMSTGK